MFTPTHLFDVEGRCIFRSTRRAVLGVSHRRNVGRAYT
jgi:hypothetical protein